MKNMRHILAVSVLSLSFAFAGGITVGVNSDWTDLDGNATSATGYTVLFDFNDDTKLGFDTQYGMLAVIDVVAGANLRLGFAGAKKSLGVGYDVWSSGGSGVGTTLGVSVNYGKSGPGADNEDVSMNLSLKWSVL